MNQDTNLRKKNQKNKIIVAVLLLITVIGIGYAVLGATVQINGTSQIVNASWDVHFKNNSITPTNGSVTIDTSNNEQAATIDSATQVSYAVKLAVPGDFYEFTVQVENTGSIDAMIDSISSKLGNTEITTGTLPSYINYSVTYSDGTPIAAKQLLAASGGTETIKVRIEFKEDVSSNELPQEAATLNLNFQINYVQADNTAVAVLHPTFADTPTNYINDATNPPTTSSPTTPPSGKNVYLGLYADNQYGVCIKRNGTQHCFRYNNWIAESNHVQEVFSDISCDVSSSFVICSASDFTCRVDSDGYVDCFDLGTSEYCTVYGAGSVKCS